MCWSLLSACVGQSKCWQLRSDVLVAGSELSSWLRVEECGGVSACAVPGFVDNLFFSGCANVIGVLWRLF